MGARAVLLATICAAVAVGCGNRLSHDEVVAQNITGSQPGDSVVGPVGSDSGTNAAGSGDATMTPDDARVSGAPTGVVKGVGAAAGGGAASTGSSPVAGAKSPLPIAIVGWMSGIGGQTNTAARDVLGAWTKWVNAKGGINGHPVQLYVGDDGGNEARSVSIVRDFVENKHVIALVHYTSGSAVAVSNYAKSKNIPIVGGLTIEDLWTQNPMMFPATAATQGHFWGAAKVIADSGAKKAATVFCTEVAACQQSSDTFGKYAKELGVDVVYEGRISFTQPDYTAECLQMRNAGVEVVVPITEFSSSVRLAQSCGRQGYKPTWYLPTANDSMTKVPDFENAVGFVSSFPWFLDAGFPGVDEYGQALRKYAPDRLNDGVDFQSAAWVAGRLFEKAAAHVSDNPTSQEILDGLWAMKNESLGGLLVGPMARTFSRGQPTLETFCVYPVRITGGKWTAPRGITPVCR